MTHKGLDGSVVTTQFSRRGQQNRRNPMSIRQPISVGNLLLDTSNYRIVKQDSQKAARDAIIAEQGRKLVTLAEDVLLNGLNPSDLPIVVDALDGNQNFIVIEGNRRLTAINLLLKPELAEGTAATRVVQES